MQTCRQRNHLLWKRYIFFKFQIDLKWLETHSLREGWRSKRPLWNSLPWQIYIINSIDETEYILVRKELGSACTEHASDFYDK